MVRMLPGWVSPEHSFSSPPFIKILLEGFLPVRGGKAKRILIGTSAGGEGV